MVASFAAAVGFLAGAASPAFAQAWTAQLILSPLPSPFLSDWELDPSIGQLLVTNPTGSAADVTFHYTLTRGGQVLMRGTSDPQTVPARETAVFNGASNIGGRADWNRDMQQLIARTGRLPEGEYEGCVTIAGSGGEVLVARQCVRFSTQYPDPPFLVFPSNGDTVSARDPIFEWQPVQVPPMAEGRVGYVLQVAEVNTAAKQRPEVALSSNILHYFEPGLAQTSHQYPVGALPLVSGRTYAWRVQALDGDGRPVASNQGRSEIWTFVYQEAKTEARAVVASIVLTPRRDTLRFAGDTARYEARAYDADNVEVPGKRVQWRSIDTTIARVDSTGMVTGARVGETRIVASVDGVADSALSVTALPTRFAVRFERYDAAATTKPRLLELLQSESFDEAVPKLMELLESGEFRIPIPRLPTVEAALGDTLERDIEDDRREAGPRHTPSLARPPDACDGVTGDASVSLDRQRKAWALHLSVTTDFLLCLNVAGAGHDTLLHRSVLFAASWKHPGIPRAFVAVKRIGGIPIQQLSLEGMARSYIVLNVSRSVELERELLPSDYDEFLGTERFDAGTGLTVYSKLTCLNAMLPLCQVLSGINPDNPEITFKAFAGVSASETSVGTGTKERAVGSSLALGFSIQAFLPVRTYSDIKIGEVSLDSTQLGVIFVVQDSLVASSSSDAKAHNKSLDVGVTLTTWLKGSRGNIWQIDGQVTLDWDLNDTTDAGAVKKKPKLIVSSTLDQNWLLGPVRLGGPTLVFVTPLGGRDEREATTLALSGRWGFGPNHGLGVVTEDTEGDFDEVGRGQVTFEWKRPPTDKTTTEKQAARDAAKKALIAHKKVVDEAMRRVDAARKANKSLGGREENRDAERAGVTQASKQPLSPGLLAPPPAPKPPAGTLEAAMYDLSVAHKEQERLKNVHQNAVDDMNPPKCLATVRTRCLTWSASLSVGNGAFADILAAIGKLRTTP